MDSNPYASPTVPESPRNHASDCLNIQLILCLAAWTILSLKFDTLPFIDMDHYRIVRTVGSFAMIGLSIASTLHAVYSLLTIGRDYGKSCSH